MNPNQDEVLLNFSRKNTIISVVLNAINLQEMGNEMLNVPLQVLFFMACCSLHVQS